MPVSWVRDETTGNSDHREFELLGLPAAKLGVGAGGEPCRHSPCDRPSGSTGARSGRPAGWLSKRFGADPRRSGELRRRRCARAPTATRSAGPARARSPGTSTLRTRNVSSSTPNATTKPISVRNTSGSTASTEKVPASTMPALVITPPVTASARSIPLACRA